MAIRRLPVAAAMLIALETGAMAGPAVRIEAEGACPDGSAVAARLAATADPDEAWTAYVGRDETGAWLELVDAAGQLRVARSIDSDDCAALAAAFAVIIEAQLGAIARPTREPPPPLSPTAPPPTTWTLAVSGGAHAGADTVGLGQIAVGASREAWRAEAALGVTAPTTDAQQMQRVRTEALELDARVGRAIAADGWYAASAVGLGLRAANVTALDLEDRPHDRRWLPKATISLAAARQLAGRWWLRGAVAGDLFLHTEAYAIEPLGVIARSPRAAVSLTLGLEVRFSDRSAPLAPRTGGAE